MTIEPKLPTGYYVYTISVDDVVRYIGKGKGSSRLLKFGFSQLYPAFETGSVVLVECH